VADGTTDFDGQVHHKAERESAPVFGIVRLLGRRRLDFLDHKLMDAAGSKGIGPTAGFDRQD
jgi:hypothetical protein